MARDRIQHALATENGTSSYLERRGRVWPAIRSHQTKGNIRDGEAIGPRKRLRRPSHASLIYGQIPDIKQTATAQCGYLAVPVERDLKNPSLFTASRTGRP